MFRPFCKLEHAKISAILRRTERKTPLDAALKKLLDRTNNLGIVPKYEHTAFAESGIGFRAMRNSHCSFVAIAIRFRHGGMDPQACPRISTRGVFRGLARFGSCVPNHGQKWPGDQLASDEEQWIRNLGSIGPGGINEVAASAAFSDLYGSNRRAIASSEISTTKRSLRKSACSGRTSILERAAILRRATVRSLSEVRASQRSLNRRCATFSAFSRLLNAEIRK